MTRIVSIQTNFSSGEIDPLLRARIDLDKYPDGAERLENVLVQPQGGVTRRPGLKHLLELPSAANPGSGTRCVPFEFNVDDSYMLVFVNQRMYVFKDKALITAINGGANDYLSISALTSSILANMVWTQSADTLIITHKDINPIKIVRGATDASWTASNITFDSVPKYAFTVVEYDPPGSIRPSAAAGSAYVLASYGKTQASGTAQGGSGTTITLAAGDTNADDFYNGMVVEITGGTGSGQWAKITDYVSSTKIATVATTWGNEPDNTSTYKILSGYTGTAQAGASTTITLASGESATDDFYNGMLVRITSGTGSGQVRRITDYVGSTKVATVDSAWTTTPDNTSVYRVGVFDDSSVGQYLLADPQGRARIVEYESPVTVRVAIEIPFFSDAAIAQGSWSIESGYEDVWSSTRGWPRTCSFHEGRLYFGGSKARPSTLWGSKVGLFFDFNPDQSYDDDAVEATLDTNSLNVITDLISARDLQIFTTGGEFYVPQGDLQPITPANFFAKNVSRNGSREGIRVKSLQSGTLYIQRQGKALNEFLFSDTTASYISTSISLLSSHLIVDPIEMTLRKATSTDEADALYILNNAGTLTVYSLLRQQSVVAPSRITTDGQFRDVGVDIEDIYVVVKRTFNSVDKYYVEVFDSSLRTDCAFTGGAAAGASGLPQIGKSLNVITDGSIQSNETVSAGGAITFDRSSTTSYEVGLPYTITIKTLPLEPRMSVGPRIGFKKRIVEINAILYKTQNLLINNVPIPIRTLDTDDILDNAVPEFTGTKVVNGVLGYTQDAQITVSQDAPLKLTLLGLEYKLSVYGGT
jgi:hypothetical protein